MKILVIGPSWIGDMVMSQCLYATLKELNPDASIDVMAPAWCRPILERMPEVNQALSLPFGHGDLKLSQRYKLGKSLRGQYDAAYVLPNSAKSALIPWAAGIATRTGWKGEFRYGLLNDLRPNKKAFQFMAERYVALAHNRADMIDSSSLSSIDELPRPHLDVDSCAQQAALEKFELQNGRIVGLCPGAEFGPAKQWPIKHYAKLAELLIEQGNQIWLFGSAKDNLATAKILELLPVEARQYVANLAGKTSLIEAVDLLGCCDTVVSNDSGLMHVAASVGCNIVGIYGSTSPDYTPPLAKNKEIVSTSIECRPCFKRECPLGHLKCLQDIAPEQVLNLVMRYQNQIAVEVE